MPDYGQIAKQYVEELRGKGTAEDRSSVSQRLDMYISELQEEELAPVGGGSDSVFQFFVCMRNALGDLQAGDVNDKFATVAAFRELFYLFIRSFI